MDIRLLQGSEPELTAAVDGYKDRWALPAEATPQAEQWLGVFDNDDLIVVCGERRIADAVEITDLYVVPGHGFKASRAVLQLLKVYRQTLETGYHKRLIATCLHSNEQFQRAVENVFGISPTAVVYMAETRT